MAALLELTFQVYEATYNDFRYRFEVTVNDNAHTVILKRKPLQLSGQNNNTLIEVFDRDSQSFKNIQQARAEQFQSIREAINKISKNYL